GSVALKQVQAQVKDPVAEIEIKPHVFNHAGRPGEVPVGNAPETQSSGDFIVEYIRATWIVVAFQELECRRGVIPHFSPGAAYLQLRDQRELVFEKRFLRKDPSGGRIGEEARAAPGGEQRRSAKVKSCLQYVTGSKIVVYLGDDILIGRFKDVIGRDGMIA